MKSMRKILALVLALSMIMVLAVPAFADGLTAGTLESNTALSNFTFDVKLTKEADVNNPELTPTYAIEPAAATDVANPYKVGPTGGLTAGSTTFAVGLTAAETTQQVTVTIDNTKFTAPGIYRYKITETVPKQDLGFSPVDKEVKYIDVYVKDFAAAGAAQADCNAYAIAMFNYYVTETKAPNGDKDAGFEIVYGDNTITPPDPDIPDPPTPPTPPTPDPKSFDVEISKVITGNMADPDELFKFDVTIGALADAAGVVVNVESDDTAGAATYTIGNAAVTNSYNIKGGQKVILKGLPKTLAVTVAETISGMDGYTTELKAESMTTNSDLTGKTVNADRTISDTVAGEGGKITVTNDRDTISPTGVVLTTLPFVLMLAAGIFFVLFAKRRREEEN